MRKIIFGILLITASCTNASIDRKIGKGNTDTTLISVSLKSDTTIIKTKDKENVSAVFYEYKNDTLLQSLVIKHISPKEISFELTSFNKAKNKTSTLTGTAKEKLNQDLEMDEDDEGNAYATTEYHYTKGECSLSIRIDMDNKNRAKMLEYNCDKFHENGCPFESMRVLKRVQK